MRVYLKCKTCGLTFFTGIEVDPLVGLTTVGGDFSCPNNHAHTYSRDEFIVEERSRRGKRVAGRPIE
ncbi:MAG: hypothetical protein NZ920_02505 [Aigarchaeota archaeon]|nr:hypothetical protein [Aigarchaeota archaeon]MDW8092504.1 hypothetical protein [Nitrososphaerota archaeon]